ncbi:auxin response factor 2 [Striga asiatica]|uniref:Auxin response factor 2 n=1 Tax=Striga asiatica TaxID=4170 RepID=A0A5A7P3C9_STRAF|nr:auxin response factor 2 [Striga asiatica]
MWRLAVATGSHNSIAAWWTLVVIGGRVSVVASSPLESEAVRLRGPPSARSVPLPPPALPNSLFLPPSPAVLRNVIGFSGERLEKMLSRPMFVALTERVFWGWFFLMVGSFSFVGFLYAAVISKLQPPSHSVIIRAIQDDCVSSLVKHEIVQACMIYFGKASTLDLFPKTTFRILTLRSCIQEWFVLWSCLRKLRLMALLPPGAELLISEIEGFD